MNPCWQTNVLHFPHSSDRLPVQYPATSGFAQSYRNPSRFISIVSRYKNGTPFHRTYVDLPRAAIKSATKSSCSRARYAHPCPLNPCPSSRISNANYYQNIVQAQNPTKQAKAMLAPAVPTNPFAPPHPRVPTLTSPS